EGEGSLRHAAWAANSNSHPDELAEDVALEAAEAVGQQDEESQVDLLHCLFGNPFRRVPLDPAWLTNDVMSLAQAAYDNREMPAGTLVPDHLAVLADALEDAGCAEGDI